MCQKGVNTDQLKMLMAQAGDQLGMTQQWLEQIHHLADHGGLEDTSTLVAQATVMLGEVRAKLDSATDVVDGATGGPNVGVELV